ncbi:hypothetical protein Prum_064960 [Phytohabitans rumicis]|uniref:Ester cyclase n=1 Tax=Phytohabitans rumicis TaxID=1076125 RepID=A0A6V8L970_9ACTN|nr:hypothetical protein Prum_064960 [Phytohabitans rumicis]
MTFVQIVDCKTDRVDDVNRLLDQWVEATQGKRTATHSIVGKDRKDAHHVVEIVEFPSYEEAMRNSNLPETNRIFEEMVALCDAPPTFTDLDVVRDEQLNKATARRFFEMASKGELARLGDLLTDDYHDHDATNEEDVRGVDGARVEIEMYRNAFRGFKFTVEDQLAEGDKVITRWTWRGTHSGEFLGIAPTKKKVEMTGMTIHRMHEGKIQEGWWNFDFLGALRQVGAVNM